MSENNTNLVLGDIIALLKEQVRLYGSQRAAARNLGISAPYLNDVLRYKREPGNKVLKPLGLEKMVTYSITYRRQPNDTRGNKRGLAHYMGYVSGVYR